MQSEPVADRETTGADPAEREALRRSLYRPGDTEDDQRRFAALGSSTPTPKPADAGSEIEATVPVRRRRGPVAGLAAVAALGVVALLLGRGGDEPAADPGPDTTAQQQVTGAEIRSALLVPPSDAPRPTPIATSLGGVDTGLQRFQGRSGTVVPVDVAEAQRQDGTLLVMMASPEGDRVHWTATRPSRRPGFSEVVAGGDADASGTQPAYSVLIYDGSPPTRVAVEAPAGTPWTLTVAFLPRGRYDQ